MYDHSEPYELPTPLGHGARDIFGTVSLDVDDALGLAEAIEAAGIGRAEPMHLAEMTGAPTRTIHLYAEALQAA